MTPKGDLRVLILEDEPTDAELVERRLREAGFAIRSRRVDRRETFLRALEEFKPEIVLCDFRLPDFDGLSAVKLVRQKDPDLPVIMVTGALGDEEAVELVKTGATDYVLKDRLARLGFAVEHALTAAAEARSRKEAEAALAKSEEKFRNLVETTSDWIWEANERGEFTYASPKIAEVVGYRPEEFIGKTVSDLLSPASAAALGAAFAPLAATRKPFALVETTTERKDGQKIVLEISAVPVFEGKTYRGYRGIARDVTERKKGESALGESRRIIEGILNTIPARVFWKDKNLVYLGCNAIFARDAGFTDPKDIVGKDDYQMGWRGQADLYRADDRQVIESGRPKILIEEPQTTPEGKTITLLTSKTPLRNSKGEVEGILGTYMDITEYKEAQEARRTSDEKYRGLFEATRDAIMTLEPPSWRFASSNPAAVKIFGGNSEAELVSHGPWELSPERQPDGRASVEKAKEMIETALREGSHYFEWTHRRVDGVTFPADVLLTRMVHGGKEVLYATVRDITERKQAEERLRVANRIVENSRAVLYRTTLKPEERITYISSNVTNYGYQVEDLIGKRVSDLLHPDDRERVFQENMAAAESGLEHPIWEYRMRIGDGSYRWLQDRSALLRDANGELIGFEGILVDISERKSADEMRAQLATIVETTRGAIIGGDMSGLITSWNPGAEKLYGYEAAEVIGRPTDLLAPSDRKQEVHQQVETVLRGKSIVNFETVRIGKGGQRIDVSETISPIRDPSGNVTGASAIVIDISERKLAERVLAKTTRALRTLSHANEALVRATTQEGLFQEICRVIVEAGSYRMAWVGLVEQDPGKTVRAVAEAGHVAGYLDTAAITWADVERGRGPTGTAVRTGVAQIVQELENNPRAAPWRAEALKRGYRSSIALPLQEDSRVFGVLTIYASEPDAFGAEEVQLLTELANDASFGAAGLRTRADRVAALHRLERAMEETVQAVASTVEMRDSYTAGHQRRVTRIVEAIAAEMGLSADRIHGLRLASVVHDLGKIHIPAEILSKPGKLSHIEYELIKTHPQVGYDILKPVEFPWPIADIVLQHHERLDGSGYPKGLRGDAILLEARILAVADVVEAMTSHRPYRPGLGRDAALAEIQQGSGKLYDSAVVEACVKVMNSGRLDLERA